MARDRTSHINLISHLLVKLRGASALEYRKQSLKTTDLKAVNFTRQHHYGQDEKRKRCVLHRELGFKIGLERPEAHPDHVNADKAGKWRGTNTQGRCVQCLCTEGHCFKYYHERKKTS
jgi:hypothetical protein